MPLSLIDLEKEFVPSALVSPYSIELAAAVVSDAFRRAGKAAPPADLWATLQRSFPQRFGEQLGMLAHLLASTSLGTATVEALRGSGAAGQDPPTAHSVAITGFFERVAPLTAEMIRSNVFRREEFVRGWMLGCGGTIGGETAEESSRKAAALDYRATLAEYAKAESARKSEAAERARILREAEEREAAARGWRE